MRRPRENSIYKPRDLRKLSLFFSDMKALFLLLIIALTLTLGGCATDPEDKAFFEKGWRRPGDNDARMYHQ